MTMKKKQHEPGPPEPSFDVFGVPPPGSRTLLHESASGAEGSYEIAIFEMRDEDSVMWAVRKRILFPVEKNGKQLFAPGWTSELHFTQIDLLAMGKEMLGNIIGRVSGESLQVSAARDQVLMELRTKLKEHLLILTDARDNEHLYEIFMRMASEDNAGGEEFQAMLTTIRLTAGLISSQMREREEE